MNELEGLVPPPMSTDHRPYRPDVAVAVLATGLAFVRTFGFLSTYWIDWRGSLRGSNTMLFEWITQKGFWPSILQIVVTEGFLVWTSVGVAKSRGWAFVVVGFIAAENVAAQLSWHASKNVVARYSPIVYLILFLYGGLRAMRTFGPRPTS